ncbi:MAG: nicotinate-nucleotide--dimethylbenzimidazole phosphoribosyltransferase, partial [Pseudonocardiaceae bacterium]
APFTVLVGLLQQLAARKTGVLLDGPITAAAALVTSRLDLFAPESYYAPQRHGSPTERIALDSMGLEPIAALGIRGWHGTGALLMLPLLQTVLGASAPTGRASPDPAAESPE